MKHLLQTFLFFLLLTGLNIQAQVTNSTNQEAKPKQDLADLAIEFYSIDFTPEQRNLLSNKEIELIFKIDELGKPTLSKINGIQNQIIQDSLKRKALELDNFQPKIINGIPEASIYFFQLTYPSNRVLATSQVIYRSLDFFRVKIDDFEYIETANTGNDFLIGGLTNQFVGKPSKYNSFGGGIKMDFSFVDNHSYIYGLNMSVYGNKNKADYPINVNREQLKSRATVMIGLIFGKWFDKYNVQLEVNYVAQNITERVYDKDPDWIQFRGWSPGVIVNYPIKIGKDKPTLYYGLPAIINHNLNIHGGLRLLQFSQKNASGLMFELGLSYRMKVRGIKNYKLIPRF